jgi:hypothetical protein
MQANTVPQGPWSNPDIQDGDHDAKIVEIKKGLYGPKNDMYLQIVLWLPKAEQHFVSNLYFPSGKPDNKTIERLSRLCQICGLVPQDALDSPKDCQGCELKIRVRKFKASGRADSFEYCDVDRFLHPDVIVTK